MKKQKKFSQKHLDVFEKNCYFFVVFAFLKTRYNGQYFDKKATKYKTFAYTFVHMYLYVYLCRCQTR